MVYYWAAVHLISMNQEVTTKSADENNSFNSTVYLPNPTGANGEISTITDSAFSSEQNLTIGENYMLEITFETDLNVTEGDGGPKLFQWKRGLPNHKCYLVNTTSVISWFISYSRKICFKDANKRWNKLNSGKKTEWYNFLSPTNWQKLSNNEKAKHTKFCNECTITNAY